MWPPPRSASLNTPRAVVDLGLSSTVSWPIVVRIRRGGVIADFEVVASKSLTFSTEGPIEDGLRRRLQPSGAERPSGSHEGTTSRFHRHPPRRCRTPGIRRLQQTAQAAFVASCLTKTTTPGHQPEAATIGAFRWEAAMLPSLGASPYELTAPLAVASQ
jgi:hypothetical protein